MREGTPLQFPSARTRITSTAGGIPRLRSETLLKFNRNEVSRLFTFRGPISLDLSPFRILSPDGLVAALAVLHYRQAYGLRPNLVTLPSDPGAVGELVRLGFVYQLLKIGVQITNEWVIPSVSAVGAPTSHALSFIQELSGGNTRPIMDEIPRDFFERELPRMDVTPTSDLAEKAYSFCEMLGEIIHNVHKHSHELRRERSIETAGFACYADWPATYPLFRFACSDIGFGLERTLRAKNEVTRPGAASIVAALLYRKFHPDTKLIGLYDSLEFLVRFQGRLYISSGEGDLTLDLSDAGKRETFASAYRNLTEADFQGVASSGGGADIPGVHVYVDLWLPRQRRAEKPKERSRGRSIRAFR